MQESHRTVAAFAALMFVGLSAQAQTIDFETLPDSTPVEEGGITESCGRANEEAYPFLNQETLLKAGRKDTPYEEGYTGRGTRSRWKGSAERVG